MNRVHSWTRHNLTGRLWLSICIATICVIHLAYTAQAAQAPTLGGVLQAGQAVKGVASEVLDKFSLVHRPLLQLGHEMTLEVIYEPADAENGEGIHMKHNPEEPYQNRRIRFDAKVEYKWDLEKELPAATLRELASLNLPPKGPVEKVPVRFTFPKRLLNNTEIRAGVFDGMLPTWWKRTDASGVATVYLYPLRDTVFGGEKEIIESEVQVQAMIQAGQGIPTDFLSLGFALAEEITSPTEAKALTRVERHVPTEWTGDVVVTRSILTNAKTTSSDPQGDQLSRTTMVATNSLWQTTMEANNVKLSTNGIGSGAYDLTLLALQSSTIVAKAKALCGAYGGATTLLTNTTERHAEGNGEEVGKAQFELLVNPRNGTYALAVRAAGAGMQAAGIRMSSSGTEKRTLQDCDGTHTITNDARIIPENSAVSAIMFPTVLWPYAKWPTFDYDAQDLTGTLTWKEPFQVAGHKYEVTTTVEWNLHRTPPK